MFFQDKCLLMLPIRNPQFSSNFLLHNLSMALYLSVTHFSQTRLPTQPAEPVNRKSSIHTLDSPFSNGSEQGPSVDQLVVTQLTKMQQPRQIEGKCHAENNIDSQCAQLPPFGMDQMERSRRLEDLKQRRIREWNVVVDVRNRHSNRMLY